MRWQAIRWPIAVRMLVSAAVSLLIALPLGAALLSWNFQQAALQAFDARLESTLNVLIANLRVDSTTGQLGMDSKLGEARFERVYSGWYWQIDVDGHTVLTSRSLWDQRLTLQLNGKGRSQQSGPRQEALRMIERPVLLPSYEAPIQLAVAADMAEVTAQVTRFRQVLLIALAALGTLLLAVTALQIRWGLQPLRRLRTSLQTVQNGGAETLETGFATELQQLAETMNAVLARDRQRIERGRTAAGNLAHALKTPLSVLQTVSESLPDEQRERVVTELARLNAAVSHHLARASAAGPMQLGTAVNAAQVLAPVLDAISQLAARRGVTFEQSLDPVEKLRIDAQDLQDMVGNLLENGMQWARSRLRFSLRTQAGQTLITVEDDGPGLSEQASTQVLERGLRLDESRPGYGLGIPIVRELADIYGAQFTLARSALGGLSASLVFNGAPTPH